MKPTKESSRKAVLNTSPIIVLTRLNLLEEAIKLFDEVEIPRGVLKELERRKDDVYEKVLRLINENKVKLEDIEHVFPRLGLGESSTIILALKHNKITVLDDRKARRLARELGLEVIGSLAILRRLIDKGVIKENPELLYIKLVEIGFYIDHKTYNKIFRKQDQNQQKSPPNKQYPTKTQPASARRVV